MRLGCPTTRSRPCKIDPWFLARSARSSTEARSASTACRKDRRWLRAEDDGLLRRPPGQADRPRRGRGPPRAPQARRAPGLQAHRHLRGRVRLAHRLHVFDLRAALRWATCRMRSPPLGPQEGGHPRRRPQPHRPGHRVRLLLLPRLLRADRGRLRDHHGQLQPRDGVDRLRHLRPALFRAADAEDVLEILRVEQKTARCTASSCSSAARRR
jgi:hypothetical protein